MTHANLSAPGDDGGTGGAFEIGSFDFHGDRVIVLSNDTGNWAILGQLCRNLTLDPNGQRQMVERKSWAQGKTCVTHVMLPGQTRAYPQFLIHERIVPMWLANVTSSRITDAPIREKIERAQVGLADALYEYVSRRPAGRREPSKLELARDLVSALEAKEVLEAANRELAPKAGKWDRFLNTDGLISMTGLADSLDVHVSGLTGYLVKQGIFRRQVGHDGRGRNLPRRAYQKSGHFLVKMEPHQVWCEVAYATPAGADLVADLWEKRTAA